MAPDFIVEGAHQPGLKVQIEIDVEFAIRRDIAPDLRRRRFQALFRLTEPILGRVFIEALKVSDIDGFR